MTPATRPKPAASPPFDVSSAVAAAEARRLADIGERARLEHEAREAARLAEEQRQARRKALLETFEGLAAENESVMGRLMEAYDAFQAAVARAEWHEVAVRNTLAELADLGHNTASLPGLRTIHALFEENDSSLRRAAGVYTDTCGKTPTRQSVAVFWLGSN